MNALKFCLAAYFIGIVIWTLSTKNRFYKASGWSIGFEPFLVAAIVLWRGIVAYLRFCSLIRKSTPAQLKCPSCKEEMNLTPDGLGGFYYVCPSNRPYSSCRQRPIFVWI
jgi:hypothetical protein